MKAVVQRGYGSFECLEVRAVPRPEVGDHEVLVRVRAASVHPDVWHVVLGRPFLLRLLFTGLAHPKIPIPGSDMAGIVESVGRSVIRFRPGDAVFGETTEKQEWINGGSYAEYVVVRHDLLALKPDNVTFEQAAAVPTSGFIVLNNLRDPTLLAPGRRVLVNGAGGGVGSIALQIAKAHDAHVTAVDTTSKLDMLRSLGADEVVDYTREDFTQRGVLYDLIFDVPGNHPFRRCRRALKPDGKYVLVGHERFGQGGNRIFGIFPRFFGLVFRSIFTRQLRGSAESRTPTRAEAIARLRELLEAGKLTPIIDSTFPLGDVREAMRHMSEDELHGKVILTV